MKVGKKILAVLCAVVLCLGSMNLPDLSSVEAAAANVTSIKLNPMDGITYVDEDGMDMSLWGETGSDNGEYQWKNENGSIVMTPLASSSFKTKVVFYIQSDTKPEVITNIEEVGVSVVDNSAVNDGAAWKVTLTLFPFDTVSGEISVTSTPSEVKYKVSYPNNSDYYTIQGDLAGKVLEVPAKDGTSFTVSLIKDADQYDITAKANDVTITDVKKNDTDYTFSTGALTRDTNITIELTKKTYTVTLPSETEFFTVESATTNMTVSAGDSFTFYVSPKTGANNPTVNVKEGTGGNATLRQPVTGTYVISNITADTEIEVSETGWKDVNIVLTPGSNFTFGAADTSAKYNSSYTFKVVPKDGYRVTNVYTTNGLAVSALGDNTYQIESLTAESVTIMATAEIISCSITPPESVAGFKFTMEGSSSISYGSSLVFYVDPTEGYETPTVKIKKVDQNDSEAVTLEPGANNRYSYANVTSDMVILVEPGELRTLNVNFVDGEGYGYSDITMTPPATVRDANSTVAYGGAVSFKVTPTPGYSISLVTYNTSNVVTSADGVYTISNVKENLVINVTVARVKYEVSFDEPEGKNYDLISGTSPVEYGSSYSFYATAKEGYGAPTVTVNGVTYTPVANGQYIIPNITGATTIKIENGAPLSYTVTLNPGSGYKYYNLDDEEINGNISVSYNRELKFKLALDSYYDQSEAEVSVGGVKVSPTDGVYTISGIKADQIVSVSGVTKNSYRVTLTQGEGYELTTTENTVVTAGNTFKFRLTAKTGYNADNAKVYANTQEEELKLGSDGYYSVTVTGDTEITVENITSIRPSITINAQNATIKNALGEDVGEVIDVAYGENYQFTVSPAEGYQLNQVAVDGVEVAPVNNVYTINDITKDKTITVITEKKVATVHYTSDKYGNNPEVVQTKEYTIDDMPEGRVTVETVDLTVSNVYGFKGWYNEQGERVEEITVADLGKEITLKAEWIPIIDRIVEIVTNGEEEKDSVNEKYVVTFTTLLKLTETLSEEDVETVRITGYGTLYAPQEFNSEDEEILTRILNRSDVVQDGVITETYSGVGENKISFSNYFRNRELSPSSIEDPGQTFGLLKYSANQLDRWGAGWLEFTVDGQKVLIVSEPIHVTYNENAENAEAIEQEARAAEAQEEKESAALNAAESEEAELSSPVVEEAVEEETVEQADEAAQEQETVQDTEAETEVTSEETPAAPQEDVNAANASEEALTAEDVVEITEAVQ